jgi:hypothetical protein
MANQSPLMNLAHDIKKHLDSQLIQVSDPISCLSKRSCNGKITDLLWLAGLPYRMWCEMFRLTFRIGSMRISIPLGSGKVRLSWRVWFR